MEYSCMGLFLITALLIEHMPALEMHTEEEATALTIRWVFPRPAADSRLILMHLSVVMGCVCWLETLCCKLQRMSFVSSLGVLFCICENRH